VIWKRTTHAVSCALSDVRALEYQVPSAFDTRWSRKSHRDPKRRSLHLKRNVDVEERVSTATCILERPQFLSRPQSKCQFQLRRRDCRPVLARARDQAWIFARVLRFSVATACHCQGHLLNTVVIRYWQSRLPVTLRIWNSPPKLTCSSASEKFPAVLFLVESRDSHEVSRLRIPSILKWRSICSWRKIKLHLYL